MGQKCIECGGETHPIRVIDRRQKNIHYELVYATSDSKRNVFKGHVLKVPSTQKCVRTAGELRCAPLQRIDDRYPVTALANFRG